MNVCELCGAGSTTLPWVVDNKTRAVCMMCRAKHPEADAEDVIDWAARYNIATMELSTLRGELEEARGERDRLAANNAHRISTGADLNWTSASDAAAEILKQTQSAGYTPPEAVDIHQMRVGRVCEQLDKLIGALKISAPVKRALAKERERLSAWLNKEAAAMEFASKHAPTNREARSCDAEAKTLRQVAKDLRTDDHHADEAGEK